MPDAADLRPDRARFADKLTDQSKEQYGICLRGKPGWGENMALCHTLVNTYGGRWFDMDWKPQIDTDPWKKAITFYVDLLKDDGPPGATSNGFNENPALFASGHCAMWIDATSAAGCVYDPKQSPRWPTRPASPRRRSRRRRKGPAWSGPGRSPSRPSTKKRGRRQDLRQMGDVEGLCEAGRRRPTAGSRFRPARASRPMTAPNIRRRRRSPTCVLQGDRLGRSGRSRRMKPVPYTGVQFVAIPEFQGIGTAGRPDHRRRAGRAARRSMQALMAAQAATERDDDAGRLHQVDGRRPPESSRRRDRRDAFGARHPRCL